ncbi:MAG: DUF2834 domain-containing protein [Actinobacteria bacterium]|nr:DUF2834 domain-containing protein [Actinomycetota bacterium]
MSAAPASGRTPVAAAVYFVLAAVGAVGTWYFNLRFTPTPDAPSYLEGWFANPASSSVAVDVIVVATVACIFYVREARRLGGRWTVVALVLVPLTFLVALAFTFPLFLGLREIALSRERPGPVPRPTT